MKPYLYLLALCSVALWASWTRGSDLAEAGLAKLARISSELENLEMMEGAEVAAGEISVARHWIEECGILLEEGEAEKAALLAELLPLQLALVRVLAATGRELSRAEKMEKTLFDVEKELRVLKSRYDRLLLLRHGPELTDAYPRKSGEAK